jgi:hypothetical protein
MTGSFFDVSGYKTYSLHDAKRQQFETGGEIKDETGKLIASQPEARPIWNCFSCAAENHAHINQPCWCCGDYGATGNYVKK